MNETSDVNASDTISGIPYREQVLIDAFNTYIQIGVGGLLFLFGLTFNCLSLLYFHVSRSFRHTTFRLYFAIIAILDTIRLFEYLIFLLFDKGYLKVTLTLCRLIFFTIMFTGQASIWLTVALAVEKCIIIWFPIKGRLCFTMTISKIVLVLVLCLVLFADIIYLLPNFFLHTYEDRSIHTFMCVWKQDTELSYNVYDRWKKHYFTFNTVFFHSIIPSIFLLILNWLILCSLSRQRIVLAKIGSLDAKNVLKREKQFKEKIIQLVLSSFFVIITISPRYILTMVNAFATNFTKEALMPLYIYVNLNTVFRVLEMCNYSLNIIFAILSGRTSRLEIWKLLWECLFWRIQRTQTGHPNARYPADAFLFDDDDDTDRLVQGRTAAPYCALKAPMNKCQTLTPKSSTGNHSTQQSSRISAPASYFTCCGFTIDLSQKPTSSSNPKSPFNDSILRRSTAATSFHPALSKSSSNNRSSLSVTLSPDGRSFKQQNSLCYRSNSVNRPIARRRASTVVHCSQKGHSPALTTLTRPILKEKAAFISEKVIDIPLTNKSNPNTNTHLTENPIILRTDCTESQLPAYIIETC